MDTLRFPTRHGSNEHQCAGSGDRRSEGGVKPRLGANPNPLLAIVI